VNSEKLTGELPNWVVPVYVVVSACTVAAAFFLGLLVFGIAARDSFRGYCSHGGGGELIAYAFIVLDYVWPVIAFQVLLSFYVARKIGPLKVAIATLMLPLVLFVGTAPCMWR